MLWQIKFVDNRESGLLEEKQMLAMLNQMRAKITAVRQQDGDWYDPNTVLSAFSRLQVEGVYLRTDQGEQTGPYTEQKARSLLLASGSQFREFRKGLLGQWEPIHANSQQRGAIGTVTPVTTVTQPVAQLPKRSRPNVRSPVVRKEPRESKGELWWLALVSTNLLALSLGIAIGVFSKDVWEQAVSASEGLFRQSDNAEDDTSDASRKQPMKEEQNEAAKEVTFSSELVQRINDRVTMSLKPQWSPKDGDRERFPKQIDALLKSGYVTRADIEGGFRLAFEDKSKWFPSKKQEKFTCVFLSLQILAKDVSQEKLESLAVAYTQAMDSYVKMSGTYSDIAYFEVVTHLYGITGKQGDGGRQHFIKELLSRTDSNGWRVE